MSFLGPELFLIFMDHWYDKTHTHTNSIKIMIISGPYILEKLLDTIPTQTVIKSELLLLTGVKVFLNSPAESQHILGRIFQLYHQNGNNHDHQQKVLFYTHLLKQHADLCQKQINCSQ